MDPPADILHNNAGDGQRRKSIQGEFRADLPHKDQRNGGKYQRICRIHNGRPKQHAHRIQVIGRPGHDVAGAVLLVVRIGKRFKMAKHVIAQIVFNLTRDADHKPAGQKLEHALAQRQSDQQCGINQYFVLRDAMVVQIVDSAAHHLRREHPKAVIEQHRDRAPEQRDAILIEIGPQRLEIFAHRRNDS